MLGRTVATTPSPHTHNLNPPAPYHPITLSPNVTHHPVVVKSATGVYDAAPCRLWAGGTLRGEEPAPDAVRVNGRKEARNDCACDRYRLVRCLQHPRQPGNAFFTITRLRATLAPRHGDGSRIGERIAWFVWRGSAGGGLIRQFGQEPPVDLARPRRTRISPILRQPL